MGAALALALVAGGCGSVAVPRPATLRVGYNSLDGTLQVWPARGGLTADTRARAAVTRAVEEWRSPVDDRVHLPSSGILWLGDVDGAPLALVAANVPGEGASWLLQLAGHGSDFQVTRATEYTDPGYLVYSDVLPVQLPNGRRYLTSKRVERLLGPAGEPLTISDGLSAPVDVPPCTAVTLAARLAATESLPHGMANDKILDLGTAIADPRYPLVDDDSGSGAKALDGLDTCTLAAKTGPFGSILRSTRGHDDPKSVPTSWPIDGISTRQLGTVSLPGGAAGRLDRLTWHTVAGPMSAVVLRPENGQPVASAADRLNTLQAYVLPVAGQPVVVLVWQPDPESTLSVPPGTPRLVDTPGLVVVPKPAQNETFSLSAPDKVHYRSVGGDSDS
jgi:hypothetical protein